MKKYIIIFVASFIVFLSVLGGGYIYLNETRQKMIDDDYGRVLIENPELVPPEPHKDEAVINTLLLGVDEARSDTIIVMRYNKETNKIAMISIPRDTRVEIPGYGYTKINAAIGKKEGTPLAMKTVSNFLDIPIHNYIKVDFRGVEKIVDIMGGIKMTIPKNMDYEDPVQDLYIHIKKGTQVLNGEKALHYLRYRSGYADQDLGRIKAQQEFAKVFIDKLTSPAMIPKALGLINAMAENTKTDLTQSEIAAYAMDLAKIDVGSLNMQTVPGSGEGKKINGVAYFVHDEQKLREIMAAMNADLGVADTHADKDAPLEAVTDTSNSLSKQNINIEILNSTKTKGLAGSLKKELEQKGFKVGRIGDTKDLNYSYSRVIDRSGDEAKLQLVAKESGINIVDSDIDQSYDYDITIIIGNDRK